MSKALQSRLPCKLKDCGSSDAVTRYEAPDGFIFDKCFSCGGSRPVKQAEINNIAIEEPQIVAESTNEIPTRPYEEDFRGVTKDTLALYKIERDSLGNPTFQYSDYSGHKLAQKVKLPSGVYNIRHLETKGFQKSGLFGHELFPAKGRYITVTEGEFDAAAAYELLGSKWPVVSLKNGVNSQLTQDDKTYLDGFDNVICCFDSDEPGVKAAQKFASLFGKNKVKIVRLTKAKDANEYLEKNYGEEFVSEWWKARPYVPEGLVSGQDTWSLLEQEENRNSVPYPWAGIQDKLHGIRTSELIVVTAGSGVGKSEVVKEIALHLYEATGEKLGILFFEESIRKTIQILTGMKLSVNLRIPENVVPKEKKHDAWTSLFDNDRWIFWDSFGSNDIESVCNQVRFIANNFGAKYIFLDHVSILVSDQSNGDERKALDEIMTKLRTLVQELDICLFLVSHLRRADGTPHEEGGVTSLSQLRGSAAIGQLADIVIGLERNGQADNEVERNITTLRLLKNRITGETGPCSYLKWQRDTGRIIELESQEAVEEAIEGAKGLHNESLIKGAQVDTNT